MKIRWNQEKDEGKTKELKITQALFTHLISFF